MNKLFRQVKLLLFIKVVVPVLIFQLNVCGQQFDYKWLMGFNSGTPPPYHIGGTIIDFTNRYHDTSKVYREMYISITNASICDSLGNILLYTNGAYIANANNDTMENGSNLSPGYLSQYDMDHGLQVPQGALILPVPDQDKKYIIMYKAYFFDSFASGRRVPGLRYAEVDLTFNNGLGKVTSKNNIINNDTLTPGGLTACKHANGRDWWIVDHKSKQDIYYTYLLDPTGIHGPYSQAIGYNLPINEINWQGTFSPNGNYYCAGYLGDSIDILGFDRCSGLFTSSNTIFLDDTVGGRGVAFSNNSQLLYIASTDFIFQFEINAQPIEASKKVVAYFDGFADSRPPFYSAFGSSLLGPDGKIYVSCGNGMRWLTVIKYPDSIGTQCEVLQHNYMLPTVNAPSSIPNYPYFHLTALPGSPCDTLAPRPSITVQSNKKIVRTTLRSDTKRETPFLFNIDTIERKDE